MPLDETETTTSDAKENGLSKDTNYFLRWSQGSQHEYTPEGQEDLTRWTDMLTLNYHSQVQDGEGLAMWANQVLGYYQENHASVIRTDSVPATETTPAEHLAVVAFRTPEFVEVVMTRFKLLDSKGAAVTYSRRTYGDTAVDQAMEWLQDNGASMEGVLMRLEVPAEAVDALALTA